MFYFNLLFIYLINKITIVWYSSFINIILNLNNFKLNVILIILFITIFSNLKIKNLLYFIGLIYINNLYYPNFINLFFFGFFKIHLFCLYLGIVLLFLSKINNYIYIKYKLYTYFIFSILAFLFGSLWSIFLYNWGYFWSNDSIEYILVFVIIAYLIKIHTKKEISFVNKLVILFNILILFMLRINLIYTRHNFFNNITFFYNFINFLLLLLLLNFNTLKKKKKLYYTILNINILIIIIFYFLIIFNFINRFAIRLIINQFLYLYIIFTFIVINWNIIKYLLIHIFIYIIFYFINFLYQYYYIFSIYLFKFNSNNNNLFHSNFYFNKNIIKLYNYNNYSKYLNYFENITSNKLNFNKYLINSNI